MTENKCEIHDEVLKKDKLPITYGLTYIGEEYRTARRELFPHSNSYLLGGCVFGESGDSEDVLYCEHCRKAESEWEQKWETQT